MTTSVSAQSTFLMPYDPYKDELKDELEGVQNLFTIPLPQEPVAPLVGKIIEDIRDDLPIDPYQMLDIEEDLIKDCATAIQKLREKNQQLAPPSQKKRIRMLAVAFFASLIAGLALLSVGFIFSFLGPFLTLGLPLLLSGALVLASSIVSYVKMSKELDKELMAVNNLKEISRLEKLQDPNFHEFVQSLQTEPTPFTTEEVKRLSMNYRIQNMYRLKEEIDKQKVEDPHLMEFQNPQVSYWNLFNLAKEKLEYFNEEISKVKSRIHNVQHKIRLFACDKEKTDILHEEIQDLNEHIERCKEKRLEVKAMLPEMKAVALRDQPFLLNLMNLSEGRLDL